MTINEKALEVNLEELNAGAGEIGENNAGPFVEKYLNKIVEPPANWCAGLQSWCFREAAKRLGVPMPFPYSLGARKTYNYFDKKGWIIHKDPWPGDLVFFWRNDINSWEGHVGIVETGAVDNGEVYLLTVEGNRGAFPSKVARWSYDYFAIPQLLGFGRCR